jgi:hypothetical protein
MIDTLIALSQFILLCLLCKDRDVELVAGLLSLNLVFQIIVLSFINTYLLLSIFDLLMLGSIIFLYGKTKQLILFTIILCSLIMNVYEHFSYYQTFIYPYRDVIQWWMVEAIFITLAWKCSWRYNVKFRRNLLRR